MPWPRNKSSLPFSPLHICEQTLAQKQILFALLTPGLTEESIKFDVMTWKKMERESSTNSPEQSGEQKRGNDELGKTKGEIKAVPYSLL